MSTYRAWTKYQIQQCNPVQQHVHAIISTPLYSMCSDVLNQGFRLSTLDVKPVFQLTVRCSFAYISHTVCSYKHRFHLGILFRIGSNSHHVCSGWHSEKTPELLSLARRILILSALQNGSTESFTVQLDISDIPKKRGGLGNQGREL